MAVGFAATVTVPFDAVTVTGKASAGAGAADEPDVALVAVSEPVAAPELSPVDVLLPGSPAGVELPVELCDWLGAELWLP